MINKISSIASVRNSLNSNRELYVKKNKKKKDKPLPEVNPIKRLIDIKV
jgi:hypothetical protein